MKKILIILTLTNLLNNVSLGSDNYFSGTSFISGTGASYSTARNNASKIAFSQGMKIIGQNHSIDKDGNWTIVLRVRPLR